MAPREDVRRDATLRKSSSSFRKKETCCPCSFVLAYRVATSLLQQCAERCRSRRAAIREAVARCAPRSSYSLENPARIEIPTIDSLFTVMSLLFARAIDCHGIYDRDTRCPAAQKSRALDFYSP